MKKFVAAITLSLALFAVPTLALDLHTARGNNSVGEKADGYVAVLKSSPEVTALVADVNAKRKQEYARISKENGQPADVVAKLAAVEIIKGLAVGNSYQGSDGGWKTR